MKVLLHTCCAPCAIAALDDMAKDGHETSAFYYNPNIHPYSEYIKRQEEVTKLFNKSRIKLFGGDYEIERYFHYVASDELAGQRCPKCWWLRLEKTARHALANGFEAFTTTLLGSPYQEHDTIKAIGSDIAGRAGVSFYYRDFRVNFRPAHDRARAEGIYCQNYCGCIFSEVERAKAKTAKKAAR